MSLKSFAISLFARKVHRDLSYRKNTALEDQEKVFQQLLSSAGNTRFGKDHNFQTIKSYADFKKQVPIRDYEELKPYVQSITEGEKDVLWPGIPKYFAKTSGTTSGVKYIPISRQSVPNHIHTARNALFNFLVMKKDFSVFDGKLIFLSGSPVMKKTGPVLTGRLSGIVNHEIPFWVKTNQLPSYSTNCIDDWESKLEKIIEETHNQDLRLISGIPPWVQMYFESLLDFTGKSCIKEVFPNFSVFMFGGVNYAPYKSSIENLIGDKIDSVELYPASEGFIAFQDQIENVGLWLNTDSGIFYEFIPLDEVFSENPVRLALEDVELGKDYAMILSNNAGLWAYNLGDTVRFVSVNPYRLIVSGRIKHFISAFGEHVIAKEVEEAMIKASNDFGVSVTEFTVAPQVNPGNNETPYHEWFIEFEKIPENVDAFAQKIDSYMTDQNIYYRDLIEGKILQPLKITTLGKGSFIEYMKSKGKLGGQNKLPRLSNDRILAVELLQVVQ